MKLIFSRKGADSTYGKRPSRIFYKNGKRLPLFIPIPERLMDQRFIDAEEVFYGGRNLKDLNVVYKKVHLDPLFLFSNGRLRGFQGQCNASASHLIQTQKISSGDVFLFFGWFKDESFKEYRNGFHAIFGFMEIGEIYNLKEKGQLGLLLEKYPEAINHPHVIYELVKDGIRCVPNVLFVSSENLSFCSTFNGAGFFEITNETILSVPYKGRSLWKLPPFFCPEYGKMSYNQKLSNWQCGKFAVLNSAKRGQEFVFSSDDPEVIEKVRNWLIYLIENFAVFEPVYTLKGGN